MKLNGRFGDLSFRHERSEGTRRLGMRGKSEEALNLGKCIAAGWSRRRFCRFIVRRNPRKPDFGAKVIFAYDRFMRRQDSWLLPDAGQSI